MVTLSRKERLARHDAPRNLSVSQAEVRDYIKSHNDRPTNTAIADALITDATGAKLAQQAIFVRKNNDEKFTTMMELVVYTFRTYPNDQNNAAHRKVCAIRNDIIAHCVPTVEALSDNADESGYKRLRHLVTMALTSPAIYEEALSVLQGRQIVEVIAADEEPVEMADEVHDFEAYESSDVLSRNVA